MSVFRRPEKDLCPLLKSECLGASCKWWTHIRGQHPQTGADIDMPDCAVKWLPTLLIEASKETRQAAAATESLRNEHQAAAGTLAGALMEAARLAHYDPHPPRLPDRR